jgi:hypothetical protein
VFVVFFLGLSLSPYLGADDASAADAVNRKDESSAVTLQLSDLLEEDGLFYYPKDAEYPFTGEVNAGLERGQIKDGKREGIWSSFYGNEQLARKGEFKEGKRNGPWSFYFENGQLARRGEFQNGQEEGPWIYYHDNGQTRANASFKNGEHEGSWVEYAESYLKGRAALEYLKGRSIDLAADKLLSSLNASVVRKVDTSSATAWQKLAAELRQRSGRLFIANYTHGAVWLALSGRDFCSSDNLPIGPQSIGSEIKVGKKTIMICRGLRGGSEYLRPVKGVALQHYSGGCGTECVSNALEGFFENDGRVYGFVIDNIQYLELWQSHEELPCTGLTFWKARPTDLKIPEANASTIKVLLSVQRLYVTTEDTARSCDEEEMYWEDSFWVGNSIFFSTDESVVEVEVSVFEINEEPQWLPVNSGTETWKYFSHPLYMQRRAAQNLGRGLSKKVSIEGYRFCPDSRFGEGAASACIYELMDEFESASDYSAWLADVDQRFEKKQLSVH